MEDIAGNFIIASLAVLLLLSAVTVTAGSETEKSWKKETVDEEGKVGRYVSLTLDNDGEPHMCYYDKTAQALNYAYMDGEEWRFEDVDTIGDISESSAVKMSIDVDGEGDARIGYWDKGDKEIKYSYREDGSWNTITVEEDISSIMGNVFISLAVDDSGDAHMVYSPGSDMGERYLQYALLKTSKISNETLDELGEMIGSYNDIALDNDGDPHISFFGSKELSEDRVLKHGYREEGNWSYHRLQREEASLMYPSMVIDQEEDPHISFSNVYGFMEGDLYYTQHSEDYWETHQVGKGIGQSSVGLGPDGDPSIAYYHATLCLKYSWREDGEWKEEVIDDSTNGVGMYNSMEIDEDGGVHIAYFDYSNSDLKYATLNTGDDGDDSGDGIPGWTILPFIAALVVISILFQKIDEVDR